jgi:hypothetical protein
VSAAEGPPPSALRLYRTEDDRTRRERCLAGQTLLLTRAQMAEPFQAIDLRLRNICTEGDLVPEATIKPHLMVRPEADALLQLEAAAKTLPKRRKAPPARGSKA